jgi:branched-chain amino acid transport system permease protein
MFFGIGAYGIAISSNTWGPTWGAIGLGFALSLVLTLVLSLAIGLFSLRVRAIFFAMITLAVAAAFQTLASQLSDFTGGEDGLSFKLPELLLPSTEFSDEPFLGVSLDGRLLCYYLLFVLAVGMLLSLLRIVNSPFGRVPKRLVTAWWSTARCRVCCRRSMPVWPGPCWRFGCATTGRTPRSALKS